MAVSSNFNMRLEPSLKIEATNVFDSYGLTMTQAFRLFLTEVVQTKKIPLSFDYNSNQNNELETLKAYHEYLTERDKLEEVSVESLLAETKAMALEA